MTSGRTPKERVSADTGSCGAGAVSTTPPSNREGSHVPQGHLLAVPPRHVRLSERDYGVQAVLPLVDGEGMKDSARRILDHLRRNQHRAVPSTELMDLPCIDYRKRISELRKEGCVITRQPIPGKPYSAYRLVMEVQG